MSFLSGAGAAAGAAGGANAAANGLGHLFGTSGAHVSQIAGNIGKGLNSIAAAGGAAPGYSGASASEAPDNHMQLLDPAVLQQLIQKFGVHGDTGYGR